jgi:geranylgeranyl diphosphate synthase type II
MSAPDETLREELRRCAVDVEAALDRVLPKETEPPETVHRAMRYSVFAGGKRLRPALVLLGCRACGGAREAAMPAACAIEMVHTYSLIHDDLPAMDDDDLRRGKPTCHKAFGEAMAILAGDALLTAAPGVIAAGMADAAVAGRLIRDLAEAAGSRGMVGGQVADLEAENREIDAAGLAGIHERKTAALIAWSARAGAICAGADEETVGALGAYGRGIGLAFQIVDDVLDVQGDAATLGKAAGKDLARGKAVYPKFHGVEGSKRLAAERAATAVAALPALGGAGDLLRALADRVVERTS